MIDERAPYFIRAVIDVHTLGNPEIPDNVADELFNLDLIRKWGATWATTDRGKAYVDALGKVPLPVQTWVIPKL